MTDERPHGLYYSEGLLWERTKDPEIRAVLERLARIRAEYHEVIDRLANAHRPGGGVTVLSRVNESLERLYVRALALAVMGGPLREGETLEQAGEAVVRAAEAKAR